jgi:diaminohydroxyphosphoribosylaminopyrimidine deaminase/5-amino-6-(5-phosphoribosylamino)uracil reductase
MSNADEKWMSRAFELAERGRGYVEPNPLVGAVVVRGEQAAGEGWHERYGEAHAEVHALAAAGEAARGATLYVTLEPCCHQGKTPPCTDAVLRAGIRRVVAAMPDPFPQVAGRGADLLRSAGVAVQFGPGEPEARRQNAPYLKLLATGRPYVHAKWAMSLDGKIATATGNSKWISGEASRRRVHELRGRMDAIVIGSGTARADDPLLTVRPPGPRTPVRIVVSRSGALSAESRLVKTVSEAPLWLATCTPPESPPAQRLRALGCQVLCLPDTDRPSLLALLDELGRRRLTNILVEGGSALLGSFRDAGAIDEVHVFLAPRLFGGAAALTPIGGEGVDQVAHAVPMAEWEIERVGSDLLLHGRVHAPFRGGPASGEASAPR